MQIETELKTHRNNQLKIQVSVLGCYAAGNVTIDESEGSNTKKQRHMRISTLSLVDAAALKVPYASI